MTGADLGRLDSPGDDAAEDRPTDLYFCDLNSTDNPGPVLSHFNSALILLYVSEMYGIHKQHDKKNRDIFHYHRSIGAWPFALMSHFALAHVLEGLTNIPLDM